MAPRLTVTTAETFGAAACRELLNLASEFEGPVLGLATGNTSIPLYESLAQRALSGEITLARFRPPFAIDEYAVGNPNHPCANRAFFGRYWDHISGSKLVQQFDPTAADLSAEADSFAERLAGAGGLDLAILGVGINGHLAFNEPGTPRDRQAMFTELTAQTRASAAACFGETVPTHGLTLGLAEILAARRVLLLANGALKAEVVARALEGPVSADCPASFLQEHPHCSVVLDAAAAERLVRVGR